MNMLYTGCFVLMGMLDVKSVHYYQMSKLLNTYRAAQLHRIRTAVTSSPELE